MDSEITGFHQGDIIIRSAIVEGIADLRRNPYLLDWIFASLPKDALTQATYGAKEVAQARKWFLANDVAVFMATRLDRPKFPAVSISLLESNETEKTLADIHYLPAEDCELEWPALTPIFSPTSYVASTGVMVIPDAATADLILAPGMVIIDDNGVAHTILEVTDRSTFLLAENTTARFTHAVIKGARPSQIVTLESVHMKESYQIGCHVMGESFYLTYLHSIMSFILLRDKEALLEARGFESSTISSSDFRRNDFFESENVFSRSITLTGTVKQVWPKLVAAKVTGTVFVPTYSAPDAPELTAVEEVTVDSEDSWMLNVDGIGVRP